MTDTDFDPLALLDAAIAGGDLAIGETGELQVPEPDRTADRLDAAREQRKLQELDADDDSAAQERIILGWTLTGEADNGSRWARFRGALGLMPNQPIPAELWTDAARLRIAQEIDAAFRGLRDLRQINGRALVESYRLRCERDQVSGSLQAFSQAVAELAGGVEVFVENDFLMAVEILQSKRARAGLRTLIANVERGLRADRPVEQVVAQVSEGVERARALVSGRMGTDYAFDGHLEIAQLLEGAMTEEKGVNIPTGLDALDIDLQGGHNPRNVGKLLVIGARTGVGKTTLAISAAMGLMRGGADVLFLSCELDGREIGARAFANHANACGFRCPDWVLEGRGTRREAPQEFYQARDHWAVQQQNGEVGQFSSKALFHAGAEEFVEFMYAAKARNPKLSAVFMDHFHAMRPSKGYSNRSQEMEARALLLHQAAKACGVNLFLLVQLNRDACLAQRPSCEHINGTDAIAQLASCVWLLEFPKRPDGAPFDSSQLILHHAKMRNGQRRDGVRVSVEESGLLVSREFCQVNDCALPFH